MQSVTRIIIGGMIVITSLMMGYFLADWFGVLASGIGAIGSACIWSAKEEIDG